MTRHKRLTQARAMYPAELTWQLLGHLVVAKSDMSTFGLTSLPKPVKTDHSGRPTVQRTAPLRGPDAAPAPRQVGSLRHVTKSVDLVPGHRVAGQRIREILDLYFTERPALVTRC